MNSWLWVKFFGDAPVQLSAVGLLVLGIGSFMQIWDHWKTRGLVDTSYRSLLLIGFGSFVIAVSSFVARHDVEIVIVAAAGCILAVCLIGLKIRDLHNTLRGTWEHRIQRITKLQGRENLTFWEIVRFKEKQ